MRRVLTLKQATLATLLSVVLTSVGLFVNIDPAFAASSKAKSSPMTVTTETEAGTVQVASNTESSKSIPVSGSGNSKPYYTSVYRPNSKTFSNARYWNSPQGLAQFIVGYNKKLPWPQATAIAETILTFSKHYQVDARLVTSIIAVESSFRADAISSAGAIGLGQLKPATANWLGVVNPYDPVDNVAGSTRYISWLIQKYNGSLDHAVSAYYQGQGSVDRNGITPVCVPYLMKVNRVLSLF